MNRLAPVTHFSAQRVGVGTFLRPAERLGVLFEVSLPAGGAVERVAGTGDELVAILQDAVEAQQVVIRSPAAGMVFNNQFGTKVGCSRMMTASSA